MNSIKIAVPKVKGVTAVEIFKGEDKVCVSSISVEEDVVVAKFSSLGYPQKR